MPELILMRHAAALPAAIDASDFERPLSATGRAAAAHSARRLEAEGVKVERILFSPACRSRDTAAIVAKELALDVAVQQELPELYAATPRTIRAAIARYHANAMSLLVIGHNPGLSDFGRKLDGPLSLDHLPTAGFWRVRFDAKGWQKLTHSGHTG